MQFSQQNRREFITLLAGTTTWPLTTLAQQSASPVVGFLSPGSRAVFGHHAEAFLKGMKGSGFTEGENTAVEYRWAEGRYERLPQLAEELVKLRVAVMAVGSPPGALAARSATSTIPIVFITADDPVKDGLVASFNRPGSNLSASWNTRPRRCNPR